MKQSSQTGMSLETDLDNSAHLLTRVDDLVTGSLLVHQCKKKSDKRLELVRLLIEKKADVEYSAGRRGKYTARRFAEGRSGIGRFFDRKRGD